MRTMLFWKNQSKLWGAISVDWCLLHRIWWLRGCLYEKKDEIKNMKVFVPISYGDFINRDAIARQDGMIFVPGF